MDEIEKRLREVTESCLKALQAWHAAKKNAESREDLQDAIHELRKVAARLEIDIAVSERDEMASRPIPIPPHRATRGRKEEEDDNAGNFNEGGGGNHQGGHGGGGHGGGQGGGQRHVLRRRSQHQGGGGGGQNRNNEE